MLTVFISYRREDTASAAGRLYDHLRSALGSQRVFKDTDTIEGGEDFRESIGNALNRTRILLVLIGPDWLTVTNAVGAKKIGEEDDYVRFEIETGFKLGLKVIPVLVGNAEMPSIDSLPSGLARLAHLNALSLRDDPDFRTDSKKILRELKRGRFFISRRSLLSTVAALGIVVCIGLPIYLQLSINGDIEIAALTMSKKCLWMPLKKNTSRDNEFYSRAFGGAIEGNWLKFPLYTGQVSLNHLPHNLREEADQNYTVDPIFDFSLINNSSKTKLITDIKFVVDEAFTLPAHMPEGGKLKVTDVYTIKITPFDSPTSFSAGLQDPIALPPTAPYRCQVLLKDLTTSSKHNEIVARIVFETNYGEISTDQINLSMVH